MHPVKDYFTYNSTTDSSFCNIDNCSTEVPGKHAGNMSKHVERHHKIIFEVLSKKLVSYGTEENKRKRTQEDSEQPSKRVRIQITSERLIEACIELVTINGRPFSYLEDSGFMKIVNPIVKSFAKQPNVSAEGIRNKVPSVAEKTRQMIKEEVAGKLI